MRKSPQHVEALCAKPHHFCNSWRRRCANLHNCYYNWSPGPCHLRNTGGTRVVPPPPRVLCGIPHPLQPLEPPGHGFDPALPSPALPQETDDKPAFILVAGGVTYRGSCASRPDVEALVQQFVQAKQAILLKNLGALPTAGGMARATKIG